ncbi:MAG: TRAP transporter small permease subunit [Flavobacteriaceae bacterium]
MQQPERKHILQSLDGALGKVEWTYALAAGYGALFITAVGCAEVLGRRFLGSPVHGAIDMIEVAMVLVALAGVSLMQANAGHIRMTVFISMFRGARTRASIDLITYVFAAALIGALLVTVSMHTLNMIQRGGATTQIYIPLWIAGAMIVFSLLLMILRLALQIVATIRVIVWPGAEPYALPRDSAAVPEEV